MPRDWKGPYQRKLARSASERGKRMANARWAKWRAERAALDERDPLFVSGRIVERIVVIRDECHVRERTIYQHDSPGDVRRKRREVFL